VTMLGPCCVCETREGVINVLMLDQRGPMPGQGWGCAVCGLPCDGAIAVLCDPCFYGGAALRFACAGYASTGKRVPIDALPPGEFKHDAAKHAEDDCDR
jgi:hypothetical protein